MTYTWLAELARHARCDGTELGSEAMSPRNVVAGEVEPAVTSKHNWTKEIRVLGWLKLFARSRVERTLLLAPDEFEALLARERSRADRAGSCFSLLTLSVPPTQLEAEDLHAIIEIFRKRRRATDLTGRTQDGQIGIVLPDTNREKAEVLAASLTRELGAKGICFDHTISVYPETSS